MLVPGFINIFAFTKAASPSRDETTAASTAIHVVSQVNRRRAGHTKVDHAPLYPTRSPHITSSHPLLLVGLLVWVNLECAVDFTGSRLAPIETPPQSTTSSGMSALFLPKEQHPHPGNVQLGWSRRKSSEKCRITSWMKGSRR